MSFSVAAVERGYSRVRLVSIDVAAAAFGGRILAVRAIGASPRTDFCWLLPLGVSVVYTLDHLLDAQRMGALAHTPRYRFQVPPAAAEGDRGFWITPVWDED